MQVEVGILESILDVLRTHGTLKPLRQDVAGGLPTAVGERYPIIAGAVCMLKEEERGADLRDENLYKENPFGIRDWSNPDEVEAGVESEIKDLLGRTPKDALISDVGCGGGRVSNYLSMHGFKRVVSVDYSLASCRMVRRNSNNTC